MIDLMYSPDGQETSFYALDCLDWLSNADTPMLLHRMPEVFEPIRTVRFSNQDEAERGEAALILAGFEVRFQRREWQGQTKYILRYY